MKKRTLSFLLAIVLCLSLLPMTALAAYTPDPAKFDAPIISDLAVSEPDENGEAMLTFVLKNPDSIKNALAHYDENSDGAIWDINGQVSIDGGEWQKISITNGSDFAEGARETIRIKELHVDSQIKFRTYYTGWDVNGYYSGWYGDEMGKFSNVLTLNEKIDINASDWAKEELARADELGLIPDCLDGAEISRKIRLNPCKLPVIEVISGENACNFSEITVDCHVTGIDQQGNAINFRFIAPFSVENADK